MHAPSWTHVCTDLRYLRLLYKHCALFGTGSARASKRASLDLGRSYRCKHFLDTNSMTAKEQQLQVPTRHHHRWAMMAVTGILGQELLGVPVKWYEAGAADYDFPVIAQVPILFLVMGFLETKRFQGFKETGTVSACLLIWRGTGKA